MTQRRLLDTSRVYLGRSQTAALYALSLLHKRSAKLFVPTDQSEQEAC